MTRLLVDTSVAIALERRTAGLEEAMPDDADLALAAVTAAELLVGVELADARRRAERAGLVEALLAELPILVYDLAIARVHAGLLVHVRRTGRPRGVHDLVIAATAAATGRAVITRDERGFADLPGVGVRLVAP